MASYWDLFSPGVEYRDVVGFPGYLVGDDGAVWSSLTPRGPGGEWHELAGGKCKDGYRKVILCCCGVRSYKRVHILVLEVFVGPCPKGMTCAHDNGVRTDNRLSNLSWKTQKENVADKQRHGTAQVGDKHPKSILTEKIVLHMRSLRRIGWSIADIATYFGVKQVTATAAIIGRNWKHLPGAVKMGRTPTRKV